MIYYYPKDKLRLYKRGKLPVFACFDIETTRVMDDNDKPLTFMYIWQVCIGSDGEKDVYIGRRWSDYISFCKEAYAANGFKPVITYVFNLSYEFQFIQSLFDFSDVFATAPREVLRAKTDYAEYRCAYKLTNMSLSNFLRAENVENQKKSGFNYDELRYSDTELSEEEIEYAVNDVLGFHDAISAKLLSDGDNLKSVPYTSTGYVRREARKRVQEKYKNRKQMQDMRLYAHTYELSKAAMRGGDTHVNFRRSGEIIRGEVQSWDMVSAYPWVEIVSDRFPVTPWRRYTNGVMPPVNDECCLMILTFFNIQIKPFVTIPYIAKARTEHIYRGFYDNGRVVKADVLTLICLDVDYHIICDEYDYNAVECAEAYTAKRGKLPKEYRRYVFELFAKKCELKGKDPYFYAKFKNKINSTFGNMVTDICRADVVYEKGEWRQVLPDIDEALDRYYNARNSYLNYQQGIYVTALCRERLREGIKATGTSHIYNDTDSCKVEGDFTREFNNINERIHALNIACDIPPIVKVDGKTYELGLWEYEESYMAFVSLGAKKYAYIDSKGDYHVTVAGMNKKGGAAYIKEHGLEAFRDGTIFDEQYARRLTAHYDDDLRFEKRLINGHLQEITSNVSLVPTTYTLDRAREYKDFVRNFEKILDERFNI